MPGRPLRILLAPAAGALLHAAAPLLASKAPDWVQRAGATAVPPALLATRPAPNAVVLWRQQIVTSGNVTGSTRLYRREAVKILNRDGSRSGTFESGYDDDSKVNVEGAWTVHADGAAEELDLKNVVSVQHADAEFYSDHFLLAFRPPHLVPGDIAAFALWRKSHRDVYQWVLDLQGSDPIAAQEVAFDLPDGWSHTWRLTAAPEGYTGPMTGEGGAKASYLYGPQRGLPREVMAPPANDRFARLEVAILPPAGKSSDLVFRSWKDVGAWFYRKSLPARGDPGDLVPAAAAPAAARWVQDKVRYVAIEVGEGGYVPREPPLVARRLYGDCKDKAFLLMALLARQHVESFPVLTRPRESGAIDPDFPSPVAFNHVVLAVRVPERTGLPAEIPLPDGPAVLFDPTDSWTPWGELPGELQGARGLVVRADGSELVAFPWAPAGVNRLVRAVDAELAADGRVTARVASTSAGSLSQRAFYQARAPEARREAVFRLAEESIPGSRASDVELEHLDDPAQPFGLRFRVSADSYVRKAGSLLLLSVLPFAIGPERIPLLDARRSPIDLGCPRKRELTIRWKLAPGLRVEAAPDPLEAENPYAAYRLAAALKDGELVLTETYEVRKPSVPVSDLAAWKAIESATSRGAGARVVLVPK